MQEEDNLQTGLTCHSGQKGLFVDKHNMSIDNLFITIHILHNYSLLTSIYNTNLVYLQH
jgi:hypothetical protein